MSIPATREQQRERERSQRERQANEAQSQLSALRQQNVFEPYPITFNTEQYNTSEPSEDETIDDETSMNIQSIFGDFGEFSRKMKSSCPLPMMIQPTAQNNNNINNINNNNNNNNHNNKKKIEQIFSEMKNKHKLHSTQKSSLPDLDSELNATAVKHSLRHNGHNGPYAGQYNNNQHTSGTAQPGPPLLLQPQQQPPPPPSSLYGSSQVSQSSISPQNAFGLQDTHFRSKVAEQSDIYPHKHAQSRHIEPYNMNGHNTNHGLELDNNIKATLNDDPRSILLKGVPGLSSSSSAAQISNSFPSSMDHSIKHNDLLPSNDKKNFKANSLSDSSDSDSSSSSEDESGSSDSDSSDGSDSEIDKRKKPVVPVPAKVPVKKQEPQPPPKSNSWDLENFIDCDLKPAVQASLQPPSSSAPQNDKHCDQSKAYSNDTVPSGKAALNSKASSSKNSRQNTKKSHKQPLPSKASLNDVEEGEVEEKPMITKDELMNYDTFHDSRISRKDIVPETKSLSSSSSILKLAESKSGSSRNYGQTSSVGGAAAGPAEDFKSKEEKLKSSFKENAEPRNLSRDSSSSSRKKPELISPMTIESSPQSKTKTSSQRSETLAGGTASNSASKHSSSSTTSGSKDEARQQARKQKRKHSSSEDEPEVVVPKRSSKSQRRPVSPLVGPPPSSKESQKHLKMSDSDNKKTVQDSNGFSNDNSNDSYVVSIQLSKLSRVPNNLKRTLEEEKIKKRQSSPSSKESKSRDKEKSSKNRDEKAKSKIVDLPLQEAKSTPPKKQSSSHSNIIKKETKDVPLDFNNVRTPPTNTATSSGSLSAKKVSPLTKGYPTPPLKSQSATAQSILRANIKVAELFERNLSEIEAMDRARKMKRQADSMADPVRQMAGHLESVMFFTMTCLAFERKGLEDNSIRLFEETLKYIEQATVSNRTTKLRYSQPLDVLAERKVQIIMYKIKGMINYRLFKLKDKSAIEHRETIASINADPSLKTFIKNVHPNTTVVDQSLLIPVKNMLVAYECLNAHQQLYIKAHEQWSKADLQMYQNQECRDFFDALNSKFNMVIIVMPIEDFVNWTLNALKNLYVTSKSSDS